MYNGIYLLDKPTHMTSFGVVARVRRQLRDRAGGKKVKVGHTGTLDPFASGLMILVVGEECKNAGHYSKLDKIYEAVMQLGATSSTGDPEGIITPGADRQPTHGEIDEAARQFVGVITQQPPIYSAIKIDGERAYKRARRGETIEMPRREVTVYELAVLEYDYPYVTLRAHVSSGTYIRTLVEDIGARLGVGAYTTQLRRLSIAEYHVKDATAEFTLTARQDKDADGDSC